MWWQKKRPRKLLVVDDEEGIVDFIVKYYRLKGFITFGVTDGIAAVEVFKEQRPLITLIDVHMPFSPIDGIETLRRIKEIDKKAFCIMISRITEKKDVDRARETGANAYLLKPFELKDLDRTIEDVARIRVEE